MMENKQFIREHVSNSQIMYTEAYTEYDEPDIFDMLDRELLDIEQLGAECELLALVEFGINDRDYSEGY